MLVILLPAPHSPGIQNDIYTSVYAYNCFGTSLVRHFKLIMTPKIHTILGPIDCKDLGITLTHEHLHYVPKRVRIFKVVY